MANLGLSQAAGNFVNAYTMGKQMAADRADKERQQKIQALMGQALTGAAQPEQMTELATTSPADFLRIQEYQQAQQDRANKAQSQADESAQKILDNQRADFIDWEEDVFERVKNAKPEDRETVYNQLMSRGQNLFDSAFFANTPTQYNEEVDRFISALGDKSAADLKSGMYKTFTAPNGDVYQINTATGEREFLFKGVAPEVQLKAGMEARLVETQDNARRSQAKAREYESIASDFEKYDISAGGFSSSWEALKDFTGQQDYESELRRKWRGIKASQVVENLPPGAASDKDIEMAMGGFPPDNASPKVISSFMRGLAKLESGNAKYNELEAQWIATQGNTAQAKRDFNVNGVEVKKGDTLLDTYKRIAKDLYPDRSDSETTPEPTVAGPQQQTFTSDSGITINFTVEP